MTWLRIEDRMDEHPKVDGLTDGAFRALVRAWIYCARHETDGRVPPNAMTSRATPKQRRELEAAGLIHQNGTGWIVHDFNDHNPTKAELDAKRAKDAAKKRNQRSAATRDTTTGRYVPRGLPQ